MAAGIEMLSETLIKLAQPGMRPKDLLTAVREQHPRATKKEVVRAAFYAIIANADDKPQQASVLHDFAIMERGDTAAEAAAPGA